MASCFLLSHLILALQATSHLYFICIILISSSIATKQQYLSHELLKYFIPASAA